MILIALIVYLIVLILNMFTVNGESEAQQLVDVFSSQSDEIAKVYLTQLFQISIQKNYLTIFNQLFSDERVDVAANDNIAIIMACKWNRLEMVEKLLADSRVDPSAQSNEAIAKATNNGNEKIVNLLLKDSRVSPNNLIYSVTYHNKINIARELLTRNIPKEEIHNALNYNACTMTSTELIKLLPDYKIDPEQDAVNREPLYFDKSIGDK